MKSYIVILVLVLFTVHVQSKGLKEKIESLENMVTGLKTDIQQLKTEHQRTKRAASGSAVAFSAHVNSDDSLTAGQVIVFDTVQTNIGNAYDNLQGKFTCPVNGAYHFTVSILSHVNHLLEAFIKHEGTSVAGLYTIGAGPGSDDQSSNSVVVHCRAGQQVWVESQNNYLINGEQVGFTLFTGFLIAADVETEPFG
ncbi:complement C1q tumor necrosis factor-related protein 3-like isoform X3 [Ruditapes philippinarum]|uniref:complement C1q tumor necrosis factor-related protein 3-like isoform X3 n=1 Tax=Ruditapes philippinarum TaxID=129788 RepID=UPI00295A7663|nr:complement C1q tumor necrosis factor-related protein 3-like isoform X3 [Ruditapes philippinarum]